MIHIALWSLWDQFACEVLRLFGSENQSVVVFNRILFRKEKLIFACCQLYTSTDPTGPARTWQYPSKIFSTVYIRAAQLIVKNCACDLDSNTSQVSVELEKHVAHVDESEGRPSSSRVRCWMLSFTDMGGAAQAPLTLAMWDIHTAADPESATQTVFSTTHHYFCVTDI